jgi:hypothetical protein
VGASQSKVGSTIGLSQSEISRRELGQAPEFSGRAIAMHASVVGLRLSFNLWPVGGGIRDAAQARLISRFLARVGRPWRARLEAPVPIAGDLRAVDVLLTRRDMRIAVEAITRLADLQAQLRAVQVKARDLSATRLVIAVSGSHANRRALNAARTALAASFELDTKRVMAALAAGRDPGRDAIVVLA